MALGASVTPFTKTTDNVRNTVVNDKGDKDEKECKNKKTLPFLHSIRRT
jgi:hypothetical protein